MLAYLVPLILLAIGVVLGLVLGAYMARTDLRAMSAELDSLRGSTPPDAAASAGPAPAPTRTEGR